MLVPVVCIHGGSRCRPPVWAPRLSANFFMLRTLPTTYGFYHMARLYFNNVVAAFVKMGFLIFGSPVPLLSFPRAALSPPRPRSYSLAPPLLRSARSPLLTAARSR